MLDGLSKLPNERFIIGTRVMFDEYFLMKRVTVDKT